MFNEWRTGLSDVINVSKWKEISESYLVLIKLLKRTLYLSLLAHGSSHITTFNESIEVICNTMTTVRAHDAYYILWIMVHKNVLLSMSFFLFNPPQSPAYYWVHHKLRPSDSCFISSSRFIFFFKWLENHSHKNYSIKKQ